MVVHKRKEILGRGSGVYEHLCAKLFNRKYIIFPNAKSDSRRAGDQFFYWYLGYMAGFEHGATKIRNKYRRNKK